MNRQGSSAAFRVCLQWFDFIFVLIQNAFVYWLKYTCVCVGKWCPVANFNSQIQWLPSNWWIDSELIICTIIIKGIFLSQLNAENTRNRNTTILHCKQYSISIFPPIVKLCFFHLTFHHLWSPQSNLSSSSVVWYFFDTNWIQ